MNLIVESTGWVRSEGDVISKTYGGKDRFTCTITTWISEANRQKCKLLEDSLVAVIRPKPKYIPKGLWIRIVRYIVSFERQVNARD